MDFYPDLIRTFDGGYVFGSAGWAGFENRPDQDWQILKINSELQIDWRRFYWCMFNGRPTGELGCAICQLPDSGFVLGGSCMGTGLVRTNKFGNEVYIHNYLVEDDFDSPFPGEMSVALTRDDNLILNANHMLLKVRLEDGEVIWRRDFDGRLSRVVPMPDGSFFVAGRTTQYDLFSALVDENGDLVWESTYQLDDSEFCWTALSVTNGGWLIGGSSRFSNESIDFYPIIIRIAENGDMLWYRIYDDMRATKVQEMVETPDGGFAIVGYSGSGQLWRVDYSGERLWRKNIRPIGTQLHSIFLMDDGGYLLGGTSDVGFYLIRTEPDPVDLPFELEVAADEHDFGRQSVDSTSLWECQIQNTGRRYVVIDSVGFTGDTSNFSLALDLPLCIYPPDTAYIPIVFLPTDTTFYSSRLTFYFGEAQTVAVNLSGRGVPPNAAAFEPEPHSFGLSLSAMPNPFNQLVQICYTLPAESDIRLAIYDLNGRLIEQLASERKDAGRYTLSWTAKGIASGLYILRLESGKEVRNQKLMLIR